MAALAKPLPRVLADACRLTTAALNGLTCYRVAFGGLFVGEGLGMRATETGDFGYVRGALPGEARPGDRFIGLFLAYGSFEFLLGDDLFYRTIFILDS